MLNSCLDRTWQTAQTLYRLLLEERSTLFAVSHTCQYLGGICLGSITPWRDQKLEEVEFAQNVVKSIRSIRGDYNFTTKMKPEGTSREFNLLH